jgi:hypothetical protein
MEWEVKHVNSRAFSWLSDIHSLTPYSSIKFMINYNQPSVIEERAISLYICSSALQFFVGKALHTITRPFVLICGDCDEDFPEQCLSTTTLNHLLNNQYLIHIFAQNCRINHDRITRIPIGLDFHTIRNKEQPINQEEILIKIAESSKPFQNRNTRIYSSFHFALNYKSREEAFERLDKNLVFYEPKKVDRYDSWNRQTEYAFVASPRGNGEDCHRTWEALVLGCIPIVKSSPLDPLYDDLPVLIVKDWKDITEDMLKNTIELFSKQDFKMEKLTLDYWKNLINEKLILS